MEKQFEKWLQYEFLLAYRDKALPIAFDKNSEVIKDKFGEKIFDITPEYPIKIKKNTIKSDVLIAERPFLLKYADQKNWQINSISNIRTCKKKFHSVKFNYIELKHINWVNINSTRRITYHITEDLNRYLALDWRSC